MRIIASLIALFVCFAATIAPTVAQQASEVQFDISSLVVETQEKDISFTIEVADSVEETSQGLMFRENLADDAGMLFDFGAPREPNMWMKNTLIPLDMLFIDEEGMIVAIAAKARPHSERRISPGVPVKGVLEIRGGLSEELGVKPGDTVRHAIFGNEVTTN